MTDKFDRKIIPLFFILCFLDNLIVTMREGGFEPWMSLLETPKATN